MYCLIPAIIESLNKKTKVHFIIQNGLGFKMKKEGRIQETEFRRQDTEDRKVREKEGMFVFGLKMGIFSIICAGKEAKKCKSAQKCAKSGRFFAFLRAYLRK